MQGRLKQVLDAYRRAIGEVLGDELDSIVLYGSHARGEATGESDIDILCIVKDPFDYGDMIFKTAGVSAEISLKYDTVISTTFVTRSDYENRNTPFLINVRREAVAV